MDIQEVYDYQGMRKYEVRTASGMVWHYGKRKNAENAQLVCNAIAAMPSKAKCFCLAPLCGLGIHGQQAALAHALGIHCRGNHHYVYNWFSNGHLPRDPAKREKLRELAKQRPYSQFDTCPCYKGDK